jgi:(p)ppGpp synthase/HD superfamily hydrolase
MTDKINRAKLLANFVHYNQKRRDGEPYIKHCERVAEAVGYVLGFKLSNENIICAAFLHDCVEDADPNLNMNDFILTSFGYDIWDIVITLTHDKKLESYNQYIERVFKHDVAWKIKWADMIDNTSYKTTKKQMIKYKDACIFLMMHGVTVPPILIERLGISE